MKATTSVPIVAITADLVGAGLVRSVPRPGGNVTGLDLLSGDLSVKWLELFRAAIPNLTRIGILVDTSGGVQIFERMNAAASSMGVQAVRLGARDAAGIAAAFTEAVRQRVGGLIPVSSPVFAAHKQDIVVLAAKHRLPAMYEHRDFVDTGGLMSYGPNLNEVSDERLSMWTRSSRAPSPQIFPLSNPRSSSSSSTSRPPRPSASRSRRRCWRGRTRSSNSGPPPLPADFAGRCPGRAAPDRSATDPESCANGLPSARVAAAQPGG